MVEIIEILDSPPCTPRSSPCKTSPDISSFGVSVDSVACQNPQPSPQKHVSGKLAQLGGPLITTVSPTAKQVESTPHTLSSKVKTPLKIVLVDSSSYRKSDRLRQRPKKLSIDSNASAFDADPFEDDESLAVRARSTNDSEDDSDKEYNDEAGRPRKWRKIGQKRPRPTKRHGKLGPTDLDLIRRAELGLQSSEPRKAYAKRPVPLGEEKGSILAERLISKVDWDSATAAVKALRISRPDRNSDGIPEEKEGHETEEANRWLKTYWLDVLTKAAKDLNMDELTFPKRKLA